MIQKSRQHLRSVDQSYFTHLAFATKWGCFLIYTGLVSIIHGLIPALWPFKAPRNVMAVARMIQERGNPEEMNEPVQ